MVTALVAFALLGYVVSLRNRLAWPIEAVPFTIAAFVIDVLYCAALGGMLRLGAFGIIGLGIALGAGQLRQVNWRVYRFADVSPGVTVFLVVGVALAIRLQGSAFWHWDEFSHWGPASKFLIQTEALFPKDSPILFRDYPPASALFHYFFTLGSGFSEPAMYIAQTTLIVAALLALSVGAGWLGACVIAVFGYVGVFAFGGGFQTMGVDHLVALFFGCGLGSYSAAADSGRLTRLIPVVFALPLLKQVGMLLAVFMVCAVVTDQLIDRRSPRRFLTILLLVLAPLFANWSWNQHVKAIGAGRTFPLDFKVEDIRDSFSADRASPRSRTTIAAFRQALTSVPVSQFRLERLVPSSVVYLERFGGPGLSTVAWTVVLVILTALVLIVQPDSSIVRRTFVFVFWLVTCGLGFIFGLLVMYLFSFSEYEGTRLASFSRYLGILYLGLGLIVSTWLIASSRLKGWRGKLSTLALAGLAGAMILTAPESAIAFATKGPERLSDLRVVFQRVMSPALAAASPHERIYLVGQGLHGVEIFIARYEALPRQTNSTCWSLGAPRFEGDIWTCPYSPAQWAAVLENYDYVVIGADPKFWQEFGELFEGHRNTNTYKVNKSGPQGPLRLTPLTEPTGR